MKWLNSLWGKLMGLMGINSPEPDAYAAPMDDRKHPGEEAKTIHRPEVLLSNEEILIKQSLEENARARRAAYARDFIAKLDEADRKKKEAASSEWPRIHSTSND